MSRIYPERLPESLLLDPKRSAERAVYTALSQLSAPFVIFYSVSWLSRSPNSDAQDGEADFVVAHPDLGLLVLEVKGGSIQYDAPTGIWTSRNRAGEIFTIKDPVAQARTNKYALLKKLQELPHWPSQWLTIGHAVAFPDVYTHPVQLRPDLPLEIILDRASLENLEDAIRRAFAFYHSADGRNGALRPDRLQILTDLLAKSFQLRTPLGVELAYEDARLIELTEQQMRVLDLLSYQRRAAIQGCAGSGKTMLALEKARRLAAEGFEVLLACFNVPLARYLAEHAPDGVNVFHFHGLCEALIKEAGLKEIPPRDPEIYYSKFLPDLMLEAVEILGSRFDAIIVDEGQDFIESWWLALSELLNDPANGILYVFFDDNQNLYRGVECIPGLIDSPPFSLFENCRNTQEIHRLVASFHQQGKLLKALGPAGHAPEGVAYVTQDEMLRLLRKTLHRLINEEAIDPTDIVILTPRGEHRSVLQDGLKLGNFVLTRKPPRSSSHIQVNTIHQFKGLERRVVIIAELDESAHRDQSLILYVGCSRARVHLILLHDQNFQPFSSQPHANTLAARDTSDPIPTNAVRNDSGQGAAMKYGELIHFDPVESVVQLRTANDHSQAERLVTTFVVSDRMADVILRQILPVLDLQPSERSGGLFVVGNYGTGKSHLMSVISAIAEHAELATKLTHPAVAEGLSPLFGRFCVVRQEFGATQMPLRDVVLSYLEQGLAQLGVTYHFPPMDQAPNTKDLLASMLVDFHARYPDQGLLVVIDEMLEYLLSRTDKQLVLDLAFLREVGEVCAHSRLRFIAGLQEALFDNPRFQFAADSVRRVKDRFSQVRIGREDVAYVVSQRLLRKEKTQMDWIRLHLAQFTSLYSEMAEHLDDFVALFPIHPAYLDTFEQVTLIEKRQALREISQEMQRRLDQVVPSDQPGLLSFDCYWRAIQADASYRAIPEVREVLDKSRVLEEKVQTGVRPEYREAARCIVHALALHRLTVGNISAPIGLTAQELRDRLCLSLPIPERDADFLLTSVEATLDQIMRAVSGQFISRNLENGQYYLDLHKDVDFDALIQQRAETLDSDALDRYYFDLLVYALELTESAYVPGFRIWQREIPWPGHGVTRDGYIFLGAPNERSTAQPARDFYLHFLGVFTPNSQMHHTVEDEVFFLLQHRDDEFDQALRLYAGAREMSAISSGSNKSLYERKADEHRRKLANWLRDNITRSFVIYHKEQSIPVAELMATYHLSLANIGLRDQFFQLTSALLAPVFEHRYPNYPQFAGVTLTQATIPQAANAALRAIGGGPMTRPAQTVIEGLCLARPENGAWIYTPERSHYAQPIIQKLTGLPAEHVINRTDLLGGDSRREQMVQTHLEPEWLAVILLTLVRQGEIVLNLRGRQIGADDLEHAAQLGVEELVRFSAIARPKALPEQMLRTLFSGLGLPDGLIGDGAQLSLAVQSLQRIIEHELDRAVKAIEQLRRGVEIWRFPVLAEVETHQWRDHLESYARLLENLTRIKTPGHLRALALTEAEVKRSLKGRATLQETLRLQETLDVLRPGLEYTYQAQTHLSANHPWQKVAREVRSEYQTLLQDPNQRLTPTTRARLSGGLENLRDAYARAYLEQHDRARLAPTHDSRKQTLVRDPRHLQLKALSELTLLPAAALEQWEKQVEDLVTCIGCTLGDLRNRAVCPHCGYSPQSDPKAATTPAIERLEQLECDLDTLTSQWSATLREELSKPSPQETIALLPENVRNALQTFIYTGSLPQKISRDLVDAIQDALRGLEKITFDGADLLLALTRAGMPCPPNELEARFRTFLQTQVDGKPLGRVRIQIDW